MVVAVAEESRGAEHARPWIEQARSGYWQLIDTEHRLSDLYNLVNVPQAVWIDAQGNIVRPPETAGSTDHFRRMDLKTRPIAWRRGRAISMPCVPGCARASIRCPSSRRRVRCRRSRRKSPRHARVS